MENFEEQNFSTHMLTKYGTDLTKLAHEGKLDPIIGREEEIERVTQILCKRRKNNPCLLGDPGVGKTVIAEALAQRIVDGSVLIPIRLRGKKLFSLDVGRLVGGTIYRGQFEQRLTDLVDEVKGSNGSIILFIDELHTLIGAGSCGRGLDASNILKPSLAKGELRCIGATTHDEYKKYIEKDSALARRFQVVEVPEPTIADTVRILQGLMEKYETHHNVKYSDDALDAAASLSSRYIRDRFLPDKAIDVIDEVGSFVRHKRGHNSNYAILVTECDVLVLISKCTGVPIENLTSNEMHKLLNLEETLKKRVVGQNEAVEAISRAIRRSRAGMRDPQRPIACFLFTGPTGVGKTELAKVVASEYFGSEESMVRLDMSEYMEKYNVSKLIGAPPGYVGYGEGGQLTEAVRKKPHNLILFDEIEKAHFDVFNIFLQIMDDARLTDGKGRVVDFTNTILIMTSNIGSNVISSTTCKDNSIHGNDYKAMKSKIAEELKRQFRPEFLNRFDDVIVFRKLTKSDTKKILEVMLKKVEERLEEKCIDITLTEAFKNMLIDKGYSSNYGARALRRAIVQNLEDTLADQLLSGEIKDGQKVTVDFGSDGVKITAQI